MTAKNSAEPCTLPYPDRFHTAVAFVDNPPKGAKPLSDETKLILYALNQQATVGPCQQPKPWGWNIVENAKWQSWKQLGDLSSIEAMRLYVRTLEDVEQEWWSLSKQTEQTTPTVMASSEKQPLWPPGLAAAASPGTWSAPFVEGAKHPTPRYDHALARVSTQLYVVGGSCGGRYLGDVWVLDLEKLSWKNTICSTATDHEDGKTEESLLLSTSGTFQPLAGHKCVAWGSNVLCIGGHTKAKDVKASLTVWLLDTSSMSWAKIEFSGELPKGRGGHSVVLIGKKIYMFGGEDVLRRPLGDCWVLDLERMCWTKLESTGPIPRGRSAHIAVAYKNRYMLVFGGGSLAHCFNDLHVLDTETMQWSKPATAGTPPTPRAGCAGGLLGNDWYIMGGGDNTGGCTDVVKLDLSTLTSDGPVKWELVEKVAKTSAIACEGMGVVAVPTAALLLAFGGYNGKYHNSLQLFQPVGAVPETDVPAPLSPTILKTAHVNGTKEDAPPSSKSEIKAVEEHEKPLPKKTVQSNAPEYDRKNSELSAALRQAQEATQKAEAAKEAAAHEMNLMRRQLSSAQAALADAEKNSANLKSQLEEEQSKSFKLEVEVAELKKQLLKMEELDKELETYRNAAKEAEAQKSKGGLWGYISGAS